jgi:fumarylacetoacetase
MTNETHDPALRSWVESANDPATDFPIQNLPLGIFRVRGAQQPWRVGAAIGDSVLDLAAAAHSGLLQGAASRAGSRCAAPTLNALMSLDPVHWAALRVQLSRLLRVDAPEAERARRIQGEILAARDDVELALPVTVGDYTDFYASVHHATNVGGMFRPDRPLLPNYKWVPIGYHGRASSIVVSGTSVHRPIGQVSTDPDAPPAFIATHRLDYEAEVGFLIGGGNPLGVSIPIDEAERHVFGVVLLNDWSARDIQAWEYQPLGPFLAKSFATTISPWVVTLDALAPFRSPMATRPPGDPEPLPYLRSEANRANGAVDMQVEVSLRTLRMREAGLPASRVSRSSVAELYWTPAQLVAHHASNGCNLRPGDLLGSGTISGATRDTRACLLELAWRSTEPLELPGGERRGFLEDGDEVTLTAFCERRGARRIGFGECRGTVQAASARS